MAAWHLRHFGSCCYGHERLRGHYTERLLPLQVSIDLFVLTRSQSVDLASLAQLCEPTAGQLYHYCPFLTPTDDDQLYNDLRWNVQRPQVRASAHHIAVTHGISQL